MEQFLKKAEKKALAISNCLEARAERKRIAHRERAKRLDWMWLVMLAAIAILMLLSLRNHVTGDIRALSGLGLFSLFGYVTTQIWKYVDSQK
jgi:hypothetical protein